MTLLRFKTKFGEVVFYQVGGGRKVLVVLHGFLGKPFFVQSLHERFSPKGCSIVAPYLPGHGKSFALPAQFSFNDLCDCVEALLRTLDFDEIYLIGHSLGGAVSWQLAQRSSLPIKKIVAVSPGLGFFENKNIEYVEKGIKDLKFDFPRTDYFKYCARAIWQERQWQQVVFPWRMSHMVRTTKVDFEPFPKGRQVLVLWGKNDLITPFEYYREHVAKVKDVQIHFHEGGHHWFIARKGEFFQELDKFLT